MYLAAFREIIDHPGDSLPADQAKLAFWAGDHDAIHLRPVEAFGRVAGPFKGPDLVLERSKGKDVFRAGYNIDWSNQLRHGVEIGLGSMDYELVELS